MKAIYLAKLGGLISTILGTITLFGGIVLSYNLYLTDIKNIYLYLLFFIFIISGIVTFLIGMEFLNINSIKLNFFKGIVIFLEILGLSIGAYILISTYIGVI